MRSASDLPQRQQRKPWLDRAGLVQAIGGLLISLIALFSSYDHISLAATTIPIQQQWGILWIASELIKKESDQIKRETELIRKETEQLKRDNVKLKRLNARGRELLCSAEQLCSLPDTNSTPPTPTAPD